MTARKRLAVYRKALVALGGSLSQLVALNVLHGTALTVVVCIVAGLTTAGVAAAKNEPAA